MASANGSDRTAAGALPLLLGVAMASSPLLPEGVMLVHNVIFDGDGGLFSGGGGGGAPPASKAAIAALKEVKAGEGDGSLGDCAICLEGVEAGKEMPCGHRFHGECVERWLGVHGSCPVCRYEMTAVEEAERATGRGGAVMVSVLVVGGRRGGGGEEEEEEAPPVIRIEDVD